MLPLVLCGCAEDGGDLAGRVRAHTATRWTTLTRPAGMTIPPACLPQDLSGPSPCPAADGDSGDDVVTLLSSVRRGLDVGVADAVHASALVDLAWNPSAEIVQRATVSLENLLGSADADRAALLTDLTVAYELRARLGGGDLDWVRALDAAESAAAIGRDPAALVNRALLRERFALVRGAAAAWDTVARHAATDAWREAAAARSHALSARPTIASIRTELARLLDAGSDPQRIRLLASQHPQIAREIAMIRVLPQLADAMVAGDEQRALLLRQQLGELGGGVAARSGDRGLLDESAFLGRPDVARRAAAGYRDYIAAERAFTEGRFVDMAASADAALARLTGSVVAPWARYLIGVARFQDFDYRGADATFAAILADSATSGRHSIRGRALWGRGLAAAREYRLGRALELYRAAADALDRSAESEYIGGNQALIIEQLSRSGDRAETWAALGKALSVLATHRTSHQLSNLLRRAADLAAGEGLLHAAVAFQREGLEVATATGRFQQPVEASINLGAMIGRLGDLVESERMLRAAEEAIPRIPDAAMQQRLRIDLQAARVAVALDAGAGMTRGASLDSLSALLGYFEGAGVRSRTALLRAERAELHLAAGDTASALADLEEAVALIRIAVSDLGTPRRLPLAAAERAIARLAGLLAVRGRIEEALDVSDIARAVRLGRYDLLDDGLAIASSHGPTLAFVALPDELLVFRVDRAGVSIDLRPVRRTELVDSIRAFRARLMAGEAAASIAAGHWLSARILGAAADSLPAALAIVPDHALTGLPIAALPVGANGDLVVDRTDLRIVPSVRHLRTAGAARPAEGRGSVLLVIGGADPPSGLPDLRHARSELDGIARIHPDAVVLPAGAKAPAVIAAMRDARMLHFAGHAQLSAVPSETRLVVAANGTASERYLRAADLAAHAFPLLDTVILSSCRSIDTDDPDDASLSSFAAVFLSAGANNVVGTLWPIEDEAAARLMVEFHTQLRAGRSVAGALAAAQRSARHHGGNVWAAFQVIGT